MKLIRLAPDARDRTAPRRSTVRSGPIELAVFEYGPRDPSTETVVLIPGWPDTHHLWNAVAPLLADRFHVVAYDVRGHGESTDPADVADFALAELAKDLFAVIDAVSPARPVHVVAHDWGSVTAWDAVCEPDAESRIASFTSISGPNLDHLGKWVRDRLSNPTLRNLWGPISQLLSSAYTGFFKLPVVPDAFFRVAGTERVWTQALRIMEAMPNEHLEFSETLRADMISGLRYYRANIVERLLHPRDRHTEVPVQLIVNTRDVAVRPAGYDDTGKWVADLRRVDVAAGHWLPYSRPELVAELATTFIDSLTASGTDATKESL
ncbi:alpha/beta fold hydrolase [Antrihabitans spumae]|uniref:Alpha/beta fold hydrolase n=1 Tax=Antrihabitans spumae TaxID=3373370 RepID=A0ABW7K4B6_9NOCA